MKNNKTWYIVIIQIVEFFLYWLSFTLFAYYTIVLISIVKLSEDYLANTILTKEIAVFTALIIFLHELGHYIFGKMFAYKVNEFKLGYVSGYVSLARVNETLKSDFYLSLFGPGSMLIVILIAIILLQFNHHLAYLLLIIGAIGNILPMLPSPGMDGGNMAFIILRSKYLIPYSSYEKAIKLKRPILLTVIFFMLLCIVYKFNTISTVNIKTVINLTDIKENFWPLLKPTSIDLFILIIFCIGKYIDIFHTEKYTDTQELEHNSEEIKYSDEETARFVDNQKLMNASEINTAIFAYNAILAINISCVMIAYYNYY